MGSVGKRKTPLFPPGFKCTLVCNACSSLSELVKNELKPIRASSEFGVYTKLITRCIVQHMALFCLCVLHSIAFNYQHLLWFQAMHLSWPSGALDLNAGFSVLNRCVRVAHGTFLLWWVFVLELSVHRMKSARAHANGISSFSYVHGLLKIAFSIPSNSVGPRRRKQPGCDKYTLPPEWISSLRCVWL